MAARKNPVHIEQTRQKIRTSQLLNRLTNHVLRNTKMSATQVSAALGLLKKTIPDIQAIEHLGEIQHKHAVVQSTPLTPEQWNEKYGIARATSEE